MDLLDAKTAEEVFGEIETIDELESAYKKLAFEVHPDRCKEPKATEKFVRLNSLHEHAKELIIKGNYGKKIPLGAGTADQIIVFGKKQITGIVPFKTGSIANTFLGELEGKKVLIKMAKSAKDNDLLLQEEKAYKKIDKLLEDRLELTILRKNHVGKLHYSFLYNGLRTNILDYYPNAMTLAEAKEHSLDERTVIWIWKRMLAALTVIHAAKICHNGLTPDNLLIDPEDHNGIVVDFCYSTESTPKIINNEYKSFYPKEVFEKQSLDGRTDIFILSKTILSLIPKFSARFENLLKACTLTYGRLSDLEEIFGDITTIAEGYYGPPKFHPFPYKGKTKKT